MLDVIETIEANTARLVELKDTFRTKLNQKGVITSGTESHAQLIDRVADITIGAGGDKLFIHQERYRALFIWITDNTTTNTVSVALRLVYIVSGRLQVIVIGGLGPMRCHFLCGFLYGFTDRISCQTCIYFRRLRGFMPQGLADNLE